MVTLHPALRMLQEAQAHKARIVTKYDDCYRYALPGRLGKDEEELYDSTAVDSMDRFAARMASTLTPVGMRFGNLVAGSDVPVTQRNRVNILLSAVAYRYFELMGQSNFWSVISEAFMDLGAGTCTVLQESFPDRDDNVFTVYPYENLDIDEGVDGKVDRIWVQKEMYVDRIRAEWDGIKIPDNDIARGADEATQKLPVILSNMKEGNEYVFRVFSGKSKKVMIESSYGTGNPSPWACCRFKKASGERWGRGPLIAALADIKSADATVMLILQNASLAVSGAYTAADDGVLNPNTVEIAPGVIIPVAYNGGTNGRSLDALPRSGDFNVSDIVLNDLRQSIRRKMYDDALAPLDKAVRSAQEVALRRQLLADVIGPSNGRIQDELLSPIVGRGLHSYAQKGLLPPVKIDGKFVKLDYSGPLTDLQNSQDLDRINDAAARINNIIPGGASVAFRPQKLLPFITNKSGVDPSLAASEEEVEQGMKDMASYAASGGDIGKAMQDANP